MVEDLSVFRQRLEKVLKTLQDKEKKLFGDQLRLVLTELQGHQLNLLEQQRDAGQRQYEAQKELRKWLDALQGHVNRHLMDPTELESVQRQLVLLLKDQLVLLPQQQEGTPACHSQECSPKASSMWRFEDFLPHLLLLSCIQMCGDITAQLWQLNGAWQSMLVVWIPLVLAYFARLASSGKNTDGWSIFFVVVTIVVAVSQFGAIWLVHDCNKDFWARFGFDILVVCSFGIFTRFGERFYDTPKCIGVGNYGANVFEELKMHDKGDELLCFGAQTSLDSLHRLSQEVTLMITNCEEMKGTKNHQDLKKHIALHHQVVNFLSFLHIVSWKDGNTSRCSSAYETFVRRIGGECSIDRTEVASSTLVLANTYNALDVVECGEPFKRWQGFYESDPRGWISCYTFFALPVVVGVFAFLGATIGLDLLVIRAAEREYNAEAFAAAVMDWAFADVVEVSKDCMVVGDWGAMLRNDSRTISGRLVEYGVWNGTSPHRSMTTTPVVYRGALEGSSPRPMQCTVLLASGMDATVWPGLRCDPASPTADSVETNCSGVDLPSHFCQNSSVNASVVCIEEKAQISDCTDCATIEEFLEGKQCLINNLPIVQLTATWLGDARVDPEVNGSDKAIAFVDIDLHAQGRNAAIKIGSAIVFDWDRFASLSHIAIVGMVTAFLRMFVTAFPTALEEADSVMHVLNSTAICVCWVVVYHLSHQLHNLGNPWARGGHYSIWVTWPLIVFFLILFLRPLFILWDVWKKKRKALIDLQGELQKLEKLAEAIEVKWRKHKAQLAIPQLQLVVLQEKEKQARLVIQSKKERARLVSQSEQQQEKYLEWIAIQLEWLGFQSDKLARLATQQAELDIQSEERVRHAIERARLAVQLEEEELARHAIQQAQLDIQSRELAWRAIQSVADELTGLAIQSEQLVSLAIQSEQLVSLAIQSEQLVSLAIQSEQLVSLAIQSEQLVSLAIQLEQLARLVIQSEQELAWHAIQSEEDRAPFSIQGKQEEEMWLVALFKTMSSSVRRFLVMLLVLALPVLLGAAICHWLLNPSIYEMSSCPDVTESPREFQRLQNMRRLYFQLVQLGLAVFGSGCASWIPYCLFDVKFQPKYLAIATAVVMYSVPIVTLLTDAIAMPSALLNFGEAFFGGDPILRFRFHLGITAYIFLLALTLQAVNYPSVEPGKFGRAVLSVALLFGRPTEHKVVAGRNEALWESVKYFFSNLHRIPLFSLDLPHFTYFFLYRQPS